MAVVRLQYTIPRHRLAYGVKHGGHLPRRVRHRLARRAPRCLALFTPERVGWVGVGLRVKAHRRLGPVGRRDPVPHLAAGGFPRELAAWERGLGHPMRLLGDGTAPARGEEVRLVRPLRLAQNLGDARGARVRRVHAEEVVAREQRHAGRSERSARGREQREQQRIRQKDAGGREQRPLAARVVVAEDHRAVARAAVLSEPRERHRRKDVAEKENRGSREQQRLRTDG
mmetsp:Transcript_26058/g.60268  ORF Transcript_26058/g.60268 Transcript_26058/m.60268 type:complete len:228 (+) Transcript_26058:1281-1964(+)